MKKVILLMICSCFIFTSSAMAQSTLSLGGGSFTPNEDVLSDFDTGFNASASYITQASDLFAYGIDLSLNQSEAENSVSKVTLSTLGVEALIYIQPNQAKVQPFAGIGIGAYGNNITAEYNDVEYFDDSGSAFGFVAKGGLRLFLDNKFFMSGYIKYYRNNQDFEDINGSTDTKDMGGTCFVFSIGAKL